MDVSNEYFMYLLIITLSATLCQKAYIIILTGLTHGINVAQEAPHTESRDVAC